MQRLPAEHPQLQFLSNVRYFSSYLESTNKSRYPLALRDLFVNPCEYYLALASIAEEMPRKKRSIPNSGSFSIEQVSLLLPILKDYSSSNRMFCFYHRYYLGCLEDSESAEDRGYDCEIDELPEIMKMPGNDFSPTIFWSENKTWFFLNDYDQACGIFGGPAALGRTLRDCLPFRTFEVSANVTLEEVDSEFWNSVETLDAHVFR